jgi:nickel/cobalt exporter
MPPLPRLYELLRGRDGEPLFLVFALLVAFLLGAIHALTPGHGKTLVAAYLAGSRGRLMDAVYLGGVVTVTHTASVLLLGLTTLWTAQFLPLHRIVPVLALVSGLLVAGLGAWLLWQRAHGRELSSALDRHHAFDGTFHGRGALLSLGVSGGLVPCPEALAVLLLSVSLGRVGFGLALLTAFTLGLAAVLIAIGCAMVLSGPAVKRLAGEGQSRWLPLLGATVVTVLGAAMVLQAARDFRG